MTTRSCLHQLKRRGALLSIAAALVIASPAMAQNTASTSGNAAKTMEEGGYSRWNFSESFGWQWFQFAQGGHIRPLTLDSGFYLRFAFTQDFSKYVSVEEALGFGNNRAEFIPFGVGNTRGLLQTRNYHVEALGVLHFTPRDARIRPFVVLGPGAVWFQPSQRKNFGQTGPAALIFPPTLETKLEPALVYGLGIKYNINRRYGLRADLRGNWAPQPHFGIANPAPLTTGAIYIPQHGTVSALQLTVGVVFRFGWHEPPPPPVVAVVEPPKVVVPALTISSISGGKDVCPGDNLPLTVTASGGPSGGNMTWQWYVNDQPAPGATSSSFVVPTADGSGSRTIKVMVTAGDMNKTSETVSIRIKTAAAPTVRFSVSPTTIAYGDKLPLSAQTTGSECSDPVTVRYTASEGAISGNTYDSSGVSFDMNNRVKQQSKSVTLTATATDRLGKSATANATVSVTLTPQAKRLDDIVFQSMSSRVNNCGKRILLEQLTPMLRDDPNAKVILIGHRDNSERASSKVDEKRVLNAAAILSAGSGICPSLDLSRILVNYAGTDQTAETRPALCGSSVTERSGQAVKDSDKRAQFRRVEIWIVPGGADMPAGTSGFQAAPDKQTKALKCPR
jgi:outer membrane protein OmpA-like peptidoglycan-associated protein